jgi:hypothetical protein
MAKTWTAPEINILTSMRGRRSAKEMAVRFDCSETDVVSKLKELEGNLLARPAVPSAVPSTPQAPLPEGTEYVPSKQHEDQLAIVVALVNKMQQKGAYGEVVVKISGGNVMRVETTDTINIPQD